MRNDRDRLVDIAAAARAIEGFVAGYNAPSFADNDLVRSAVFAKLVIIGEATRNLSPLFTDVHPHIPWAQIIGTRNRIAHGYDQVDWDIVWHIATVDVPKLLGDVDAILQSSSG
jgi:uncharacterized protein with HEPN domain